jgi:hypothetical protein
MHPARRRTLRPSALTPRAARSPSRHRSGTTRPCRDRGSTHWVSSRPAGTAGGSDNHTSSGRPLPLGTGTRTARGRLEEEQASAVTWRQLPASARTCAPPPRSSRARTRRPQCPPDKAAATECRAPHAGRVASGVDRPGRAASGVIICLLCELNMPTVSFFSPDTHRAGHAVLLSEKHPVRVLGAVLLLRNQSLRRALERRHAQALGARHAPTVPG